MSPAFNPQKIKEILYENGVSWIQRSEYFESIDSSNDYLLGLRGSLHGRVCICDYQARGKGRLGKQWHSTAGLNLMFSLGWVPGKALLPEVSLVVGVALADALKCMGVEGIGLNWPNDIQHDGRKLAGVLIESRVRGSQAELVIGVGLNVQHRPSDMAAVDQPWTDLWHMGHSNIDRQQLLIRILIELARRLEQLETQGFRPIREDWLGYHAYQGTTMNYCYQGETREGKVVGLNNRGALLFDFNGEQVAVSSGEVSRLRAQL